MKRKYKINATAAAIGGIACVLVLSGGIILVRGQKDNYIVETPVAGMSVVVENFIENSGTADIERVLVASGIKQEAPGKNSVDITEEETTPAEENNAGEQTNTGAEADNIKDTETSTPIETTPEETTPEETAHEETIPEETTPAAEESPYSGIAVAVCDSYVNVRSGPSTDYKILGKIYKDCAAEILEETDGWYKMTSGNLTGYIKAEYFATGEEAGRLAEELGKKIGKVTASALRLRKEASLEAKILTNIPNGEECAVLYEDDEWAKVQVDTTVGWVFKEYLDIRVEFDTAITLEEERAKKAEEEAVKKQIEAAVASAKEDELRAAIVNYALQFVGNKYVYGGNSLTEGTDCSGFVKLIYQEFGYSLQRRASLQYRDGVKIDWTTAKPGDLFFYGDESVDHVVMYIGGDKVVHASNPTMGIRVSTINYKRMFGAIRVIQ